MRDRLYTTEAIILRRSDVGEADRLLTIYTLREGKIAVSARGVRKTTSKLAGHLELFIHTHMQLARGRTFDVVTESRVIDHFVTLRNDLDRISLACYVAELLDQMTPEQTEQPAVFMLLRDTLTAIDTIDDAVRHDIVLRFYELHMLILAGYRPHLFFCAGCEQELTPQANRFNPVNGGVLCANCATHIKGSLALELPVFKFLRFLARGTIIDALDLHVSAQLVRDAGIITKTALRQVLERELKSVVLLNQLRG